MQLHISKIRANFNISFLLNELGKLNGKTSVE